MVRTDPVLFSLHDLFVIVISPRFVTYLDMFPETLEEAVTSGLNQQIACWLPSIEILSYCTAVVSRVS